MEIINQLSVLAGFYGLLFLLFFWVRQMKSDSLISSKVQNGRWVLLHIRHAGGTIIMALLPLLLLPGLPEEILTWPNDISSIHVIALMIAGLILLIISAKEADLVENKKPVITRKSSFNAVLHIILRSAFLAGYEWFFRGCILLSCVSLFGAAPAVIINLVLYALIHSFNGKKEMLGSIPFGLLLCAFTLWWHSVWPAILLHLLLSSTYESVILHPFFCKPSKQIL